MGILLVGRKGRWEWWTKKFKVSKIIETIKLKDDDFRKREDLSPNYYQSMPISAQFEDDPGSRRRYRAWNNLAG